MWCSSSFSWETCPWCLSSNTHLREWEAPIVLISLVVCVGREIPMKHFIGLLIALVFGILTASASEVITMMCITILQECNSHLISHCSGDAVWHHPDGSLVTVSACEVSPAPQRGIVPHSQSLRQSQTPLWQSLERKPLPQPKQH